ncbi:MAG: hypothetical protein JSU94_14105 [Phycisphaerales bacterium]|nr:MAG: hypothetical protein JSU94_14105 [Phycisphaerales bacterium]
MNKTIGVLAAAFYVVFAAGAFAEVVFEPSVRVNDVSAGSQKIPSVAVDSAGVIYAVWNDARDNTARRVYFAKSTDDGGSFGQSVRVDDGPAKSTQLNPRITVDGSGVVYVVWQDSRSGNWDIYFSRSTDGGASFSRPNVKVSDEEHFAKFWPAVAVDSEGSIYVVWQDARNGYDNYDIYFARSTDGGQTFGANVRVDDSDPNRSAQSYPSIAVDSGGNIYIAWTDDRRGDSDIYFTKSVDGGVSFVAPNVRVDDTGSAASSQLEPSIAVGANGDVYVGWTDSRRNEGFNTYDTYFARSTDGGVSFLENIIVNDDAEGNNQMHTQIAVDSEGGVYAVWDDYRNERWDIYFARSTDGGASFSANSKVSDNYSEMRYEAYPSLAVDGQKKVCVVWEDRRDSDVDIYFAGGRDETVSEGLVLAAIGDKEAGEEEALSFAVEATDSDGDILSFVRPFQAELDRSAPGASFSVTESEAGLIRGSFAWTPASGQAGIYSVRFEVSDGESVASEAIIITVGDVECTDAISGDLNRDCKVDWRDFGLFGGEWRGGSGSGGDIWPAGGDGVVDFADLAVLASNWLICNIEPAEACR